MLIPDLAASRPRMPAREGLPMVLAPNQTGTPAMGEGNLAIPPPPSYGPIVIGNLIPAPGSGGESCDANSMCGVLPLWGVSQLLLQQLVGLPAVRQQLRLLELLSRPLAGADLR